MYMDISNILDTLFINVGENLNKTKNKQVWRELTTTVHAKMQKVLLTGSKNTTYD